jgi:hypothetical protein
MKFATTLANTRSCKGIELLKLAFLAQVAYKINQVDIQLQLTKFMQKETIAIGLWRVGIACQCHKDKCVWLVKEPLNSI